MKITGANAQLEKLVQKVAELASEKERTAIAKQLGEASIAQIRLGFRQSRDPYGTPWAPNQWRGGKVLRDTGRLANSYTYQDPSPKGFSVGTNVIYARIHNYGGWIKPVKAKALRIPVPVQGPVPRGVKTGRGGIATEFIFRKRVFIPERIQVPRKRWGLGAIWQKAFNAAANAALKKLLLKNG